MKKLLISTMLTAASLNTSLAADLIARPVTKAPPIVAASPWSGWYAGINGGGTWSNNTASLSDTSSPAIFSTGVALGYTPLSMDAKHGGGFGGGQIGYNWQTGSWLLGLETDIQGADIGSTSTSPHTINSGPGAGLNIIRTAQDHIDWFGTVRGRMGYVTGGVLLYGTGGVAYGHTGSNFNNTILLLNESIGGSASSTQAGWVAGGGIEWAFARQWSLKGEYLHVDLGSTDVSGVDSRTPTLIATYRFKHEFDSVRLGINYKFGDPLVKY